jgi:hypothetical protein
MTRNREREIEAEVELSGNVGIFFGGEIKHTHTVNIVLPPGVQEQLDRIEAKIDECCGPHTAARLIVHVGVPTEQP